MGRFLPILSVAFFLVFAIAFAWLFLFNDGPVEQPHVPGTILNSGNEETVTKPEVLPVENNINEIPAPPEPVEQSSIQGPGRINVTVTNPEKFSLDNSEAELYAYPTEGEFFQEDLEFLDTVVVNSEYNYSFEGLSFGAYLVAIDVGGAAGQGFAQLNPGNPTANVKIKLNVGGSIGGKVVMSGGGAAVGVSVVPVRQRYSRGGGLDIWDVQSHFLKTYTDEDGAFAINQLEGEAIQFCVIAEGMVPYYSEYFDVGTQNARIVLSEEASLVGTLIDGDSQVPLGGATLNLVGPVAYDTYSVVTDEDGAFEIGSISNGLYRISMDYETYVLDAESNRIQIKEGEANQTSLKAFIGATITGRVYDVITNAGVAGVVVVADNQNGGLGKVSERSSQDGTYHIDGLPPANYEIRRVNDVSGYTSNNEERGFYTDPVVNLKTGEVRNGVDLKMYPGIEVTGVVRNQAGETLADVVVSGRDLRNSIQGSTTSKDDGTFLFTVSGASKSFQIEGKKQGYANTVLPGLEVTETGLHDVELVLDPESSVAGILVDESGNPVTTGGVLFQAIGEYIQNRSAQVKNDGTFYLGGMAAGEYSVYPSGIQGRFTVRQGAETQKITLREAEILTGLRVVLPGGKGMSISGVVRDTKGNPINGASIRGYGNPSIVEARTNAEGIFEVHGLQEGDYSIQAESRNFTSTYLRDIPAGTTDIEFVLEGQGAIEGIVRDERTYEPITEFQIAQTRLGRSELQYTKFSSIQDEEGRFRLNNVDTGETTVYVRAEGYLENSIAIPEVIENETVSDVEFFMAVGGTLRGIVTDEDDKPLANVMIIEGVFDESMASHTSRVSTDGEGRFELSGLAQGETDLTAYKSGFAPKTLTIDASQEDEVTFVLSAGGVIEGTLFEDDKPLVNRSVNIRNSSLGNLTYVYTDSEGYYKKEGLEPGSYQISSSMLNRETGQRRSISRLAKLEEGMTTVVDLVWSGANAVLEGVVTREGAPLADVRVAILVAIPEGDLQYTVRTNSAGYYRVENLPAGSINGFLVTDNGLDLANFMLELLEGHTYEHNIELEAP